MVKQRNEIDEKYQWDWVQTVLFAIAHHLRVHTVGILGFVKSFYRNSISRFFLYFFRE